MKLNLDSDNIIETIRKLAKSHKYQTIYSTAKDLGIRLFYNDIDLTEYQLTFIGYLNFYNTIFLDIYMNEIDERVLEDFIYEDAYMYWKNKSKEVIKREPKIPIKDTNKDVTRLSSTWILKSPKGQQK